jgi:hypothetical protein
VSHVYCPECGFQNPEAANFCSRCGAHLQKDEPVESTVTYSPEEIAEEAGAPLGDLGLKGPALVVRSGGGRAGETFHPTGPRTTIGRSPDCDVFLDDVTVSRKHAVLVDSGNGEYQVEDQSSLNGTFLNKKRIEGTARIDDGDELQVGKYRLTFLQR